MLVLSLFISLATTSFVSSFSIQSHLTRYRFGNDYNSENRSFPSDDRKNKALRRACLLSSVIQANESLEQDNGNISYLGNRFGLKGDWFTNNSMYSIVDNMDQAVMMERITWIKRRLKLNEAQLGKLVQRFPTILTLRSEMNVEPTIQFLQRELALNNTRLSTLIVSQPQLLGLGIHKNQTLQRNLNWFKNRLHLRDPTKLGKFVVKAPSILAFNVENNLEPTFLSLQNRLGINETQVAKLCVKCPSLLTRNYSQSMAPKLDWLLNTLGLNEKQLGTIIQRQPRLLTYSVDERMRPNVEWLRDRLCLNTRELAKLVTGAPAVLFYQVESMEERLQWFQDHLFLHDNDESMLGKFICKAPTCLGMDIKSNLGPTLEFFREHLGEGPGTQVVLDRPTFLGTSLEKRLKLRTEQVKEASLQLDVTCMRRICTYTPGMWLAWLSKQGTQRQSL